MTERCIECGVELNETNVYIKHLCKRCARVFNIDDFTVKTPADAEALNEEHSTLREEKHALTTIYRRWKRGLDWADYKRFLFLCEEILK